MADHEISIEQIEGLILNNVPSTVEQQCMIQGIETMIAQGVRPDRALESVLSAPVNKN